MNEISKVDLENIKHVLKSIKERTYTLKLGEKRFFVKKKRPTRIPFSAFFVNIFFRLFGTGFLNVSLKYGGQYSFKNEINFLSNLRNANVPVPKLLFVGDSYLILEALSGCTIDNTLGDNLQKSKVWTKALNEMINLHKKGLCLSQGFSRNMMVVGEEVFFIDFEENPLDSMNIHQAQTRDWIFFLLSTLWRFESYGPILTIWHKTIHNENKEVYDCFKLVAERFAWFRFLPESRNPWGRDLIQLQALGNFFFQWGKFEKK